MQSSITDALDDYRTAYEAQKGLLPNSLCACVGLHGHLVKNKMDDAFC